MALTVALLASACFPPSIDDSGDSTDDSETGDLPGDGDGDPAGDGDGDPSCEGASPTVECSEGTGCWASEPSWTAEARATTGDGILTPGLWVPVDILPGVECWELWGVGTHVCIVETCGANLLGTPADEMDLEPDPSCDFTGVWETTAKMGSECFGLIDGVAVQLRGTPQAGEMWGPCLSSEQGMTNSCNSEDLACALADGGTANICLPLGECPDVVPLGIFGELGWGEACYPRCGQDSECLEGQVCAMADVDGGSVCAWPSDGDGVCCACDELTPPFVCEPSDMVSCTDAGEVWCELDENGYPAACVEECAEPDPVIGLCCDCESFSTPVWLCEQTLHDECGSVGDSWCELDEQGQPSDCIAECSG